MEAKFYSEFEPIQVAVVSEVEYNDIVAGFVYWALQKGGFQEKKREAKTSLFYWLSTSKVDRK